MDVLRVPTPVSWILSGATMSGKSRFIFKLLLNKNHIFDKPIDKVYYCHSIDQQLYHEMREKIDNIVFYQGLPNMDEMTEWSKEGSVLIVFDDLQEEITSSKEASDLMLQGVHHLGLSSIMVLQNLYTKNRYSRNLALNSQVYVLFRNRRDMTQMATFGRQIMPNKCSAFVEICQHAFDHYGYLMVVTDPRLEHNELMLRSNIFQEEGPTVIYKCI